MNHSTINTNKDSISEKLWNIIFGFFTLVAILFVGFFVYSNITLNKVTKCEEVTGQHFSYILFIFFVLLSFLFILIKGLFLYFKFQFQNLMINKDYSSSFLFLLWIFFFIFSEFKSNNKRKKIIYGYLIFEFILFVLFIYLIFLKIQPWLTSLYFKFMCYLSKVAINSIN